jgi:hypothetical protein
MLHAWVERFDVIGVRGSILGWDGEVNKARISFPLQVDVASSNKFIIYEIGVWHSSRQLHELL